MGKNNKNKILKIKNQESRYLKLHTNLAELVFSNTQYGSTDILIDDAVEILNTFRTRPPSPDEEQLKQDDFDKEIEEAFKDYERSKEEEQKKKANKQQLIKYIKEIPIMERPIILPMIVKNKNLYETEITLELP